MDKVPMTVADLYPETGPSRTSQLCPPPLPPTPPVWRSYRRKGGSEKALGDDKEISQSLVLSLDRDLLCKLGGLSQA